MNPEGEHVPPTLVHLRVERAASPQGIDVAPRISWALAGGGRGVRVQTLHISVTHGGRPIWSWQGPMPTMNEVECPLEVLQTDHQYDVEIELETTSGTAHGAATFRTGLLRLADWANSVWMSAPQELLGPAPLFRAEFDLPSSILGARLYLAAGGFARVLINGVPAADEVLGPGITSYDRRVQYAVWDVAGLLRPGRNVLTAEVGKSFYAITEPNTWEWQRAPWNADPSVRLLLLADDRHGMAKPVLASGKDFRVTAGPTRYDDLYGGESVDLRLDDAGIHSPGYDDQAWARPRVVPGPAGKLVHRRQPPIRVQETLPGKAISHTHERVVFDFGRVIAGWVRLNINGEAGLRVDLRYGERLNSAGRPDDSDPAGYYNGRFQHDSIVLRDGPQSWEPRFGWKGFRYVEIAGWPGDVNTGDIVACRVHTDVEVTGSFSASDPTIQAIHRITVATILNNLHSIPTDTPTYEKNGWTADGMLGTEMFLLNLDAHELLAKWADDIGDSRDDLGVPHVIAPHGGWAYDWSPAPTWHAAYILVPWWLYRYGGDTRVLSRHFDGICAYLDVEYARSPGGIANTTLGDWVSPQTPPGGGNPPEDLRVAATVYLFTMLDTAARIAEILDQPSAKLRGRAETVRAAFLNAFYNQDAASVCGQGEADYRQSHNTLAVAHGLIPYSDRRRVTDGIAADVRRRGVHLNTGALATKHLLPVLTEFGHPELALALARQRTYPSWGYWLDHGATTLWEHWHADSRSQNHYFLGTVDEWFYASVAGIALGDVAFRRIWMRPRLIGLLNAAAASIRTPFGEASIDWSINGDNCSVAIGVPPGSVADVTLPVANAESLREQGRSVFAVPGVSDIRAADGVVMLVAASGTYQFTFSVQRSSIN
jgi:alpha-L-rhamnosidase